MHEFGQVLCSLSKKFSPDEEYLKPSQRSMIEF